jgi:hypothetical protein
MMTDQWAIGLRNIPESMAHLLRTAGIEQLSNVYRRPHPFVGQA